MPDCNTCARKNCKGNIIRDKNGNPKSEKDCPGYVPYKDFRFSLVTKNSEIYQQLQELAGKPKSKKINKRWKKKKNLSKI